MRLLRYYSGYVYAFIPDFSFGHTHKQLFVFYEVVYPYLDIYIQLVSFLISILDPIFITSLRY